MGAFTLVGTPQGTYAMGGNGDNRKNEVLQLDCPGDHIQSCQWLEMPEKLEYRRSDHVSIPLPDSYKVCNEIIDTPEADVLPSPDYIDSPSLNTTSEYILQWSTYYK